MWKVLLLALLLSGCARDLAVRIGEDDSYTRADVDAIIAENACKHNARTMVQIARCTR